MNELRLGVEIFSRLFRRVLLVFLSSGLCACIVVPKQVAGYDPACKVVTRKFELSVEQMNRIEEIRCTNNDCDWDLAEEIIESAFVLTTSALVSGSIALAGNTLFWLEQQGNCPGAVPEKKELPPQPPATDDQYLIHEEIITAKS